MRGTVRVEGFKELQAALAQIEKETTRKTVARRALKKAGEPVAAKMRSLAPRGEGQLQDNIAVSTKVKNEVGAAAYAATMRGGGTSGEAVAAMRGARREAKAAGIQPPVFMYVGPTTRAPHAHLVEFGTGPHINGGLFAGSQHPGTTPQPFARPAWDAEQDAALKRIATELAAEIEKAARRAARKAARG